MCPQDEGMDAQAPGLPGHLTWVQFMLQPWDQEEETAAEPWPGPAPHPPQSVSLAALLLRAQPPSFLHLWLPNWASHKEALGHLDTKATSLQARMGCRGEPGSAQRPSLQVSLEDRGHETDYGQGRDTSRGPPGAQDT